MSKLKKTISFFFVVCMYISIQAQEKIDTDRPDQTESAGIVPKNYFQVEIGFNKENTTRADHNYIHPTTLLKYGFRRFELRLETVFLSTYEQSILQPKWTTGLEPVEIGCKVLLAEEKKGIPKTSFIAHLGIPALSSKAFRYDNVVPSFRLVLQKTITPFYGIGTNIGAEWDGYTSAPTWLYTLSPGFNLSEKWYAYIEAFGFIRKNELPQHNLDGGIAYYLTNDIKLDISAGAGISRAAPENYFAIGVSFRFSTKHRSGNRNPGETNHVSPTFPFCLLCRR
jgi:hypothetical protein